MAERDSSEERTYDPSAHKVEQHRREGRIAQSKDVTSAFQLFIALLAFSLVGNQLLGGVMKATRWTIEEAAGQPYERIPTLADTLAMVGGTVLPPMAGICLMLMCAVLFVGLLQTKFLWATEAIAFKPERINPFSRITEVFNPKKLSMNMLLAVAKLVVAGSVLGGLLVADMPLLTSLALAPLSTAEVVVRSQLNAMLVATTIVIAIMAGLDYAWQLRQHGQQVKMTRDEFKRDMEEQEGKPVFKQRRRQMHRELTMNRIIQSVPEADVIVTNPTHFAVALRYRPGVDAAPIVTAKGADILALHIRNIARNHGVPIVENRKIARGLWKKVKVGRTVPSNLFQAVAEILARVYRNRSKRSASHRVR